MSVDVWIFVAVIFVACSLVELAIVGHLHRMIKCTNNSKTRGSQRASKRHKKLSVATLQLSVSINVKSVFLQTCVLKEELNSLQQDDSQNYYGTFQNEDVEVPFFSMTDENELNFIKSASVKTNDQPMHGESNNSRV